MFHSPRSASAEYVFPRRRWSMTPSGLSHSEIHGSKLVRQLPVAYRSLTASFIAFWRQNIHHAPFVAWPPFFLSDARTRRASSELVGLGHSGSKALSARVALLREPHARSSQLVSIPFSERRRRARGPAQRNVGRAMHARPSLFRGACELCSYAESELHRHRCRRSGYPQKGGDPAAGSPTATLLRLSPSHRSYRGHLRPCGSVDDFGYSRLPWLDGRCVQGSGTHSPRHS
jgi:hypothetical protein